MLFVLALVLYFVAFIIIGSAMQNKTVSQFIQGVIH